MKLVIAGGTGHVGAVLLRHFDPARHEVVIVSRRALTPCNVRIVFWDGQNIGEWAKELDGADAVINLAGKSVNCRYTETNLREMLESRVNSTTVIGQAIGRLKRPPRVWLQASTATIYAHRFDAPNDESTGIIGGHETGAPPKWNASIQIAREWEKALAEADTPNTRRVAMRSAVTMSVDKGSIFDVLTGLTRKGLGGRIGDGKQFVSWVHEHDFARAVKFLIKRDELEGPVNICSPNPIPQQEFSRVMREELGVKVGLPASAWMIELWAKLMNTESELVLKSRRVVPTRLLEAGFTFELPDWRIAVCELVSRPKSQRS